MFVIWVPFYMNVVYEFDYLQINWKNCNLYNNEKIIVVKLKDEMHR